MVFAVFAERAVEQVVDMGGQFGGRGRGDVDGAGGADTVTAVGVVHDVEVASRGGAMVVRAAGVDGDMGDGGARAFEESVGLVSPHRPGQRITSVYGAASTSLTTWVNDIQTSDA